MRIVFKKLSILVPMSYTLLFVSKNTCEEGLRFTSHWVLQNVAPTLPAVMRIDIVIVNYELS